MSGYLSTHVLNLASGKPGAGISLRLLYLDMSAVSSPLAGTKSGSAEQRDWVELARAVTDADGRVKALAGEGSAVRFAAGRYRLEFDLEGFFDATGFPSFLPEAVIGFSVDSPEEHYHVPLLLSPNGFSTYRGS